MNPNVKLIKPTIYLETNLKVITFLFMVQHG